MRKRVLLMLSTILIIFTFNSLTALATEPETIEEVAAEEEIIVEHIVEEITENTLDNSVDAPVVVDKEELLRSANSDMDIQILETQFELYDNQIVNPKAGLSWTYTRYYEGSNLFHYPVNETGNSKNGEKGYVFVDNHNPTPGSKVKISAILPSTYKDVNITISSLFTDISYGIPLSYNKATGYFEGIFNVTKDLYNNLYYISELKFETGDAIYFGDRYNYENSYDIQFVFLGGKILPADTKRPAVMTSLAPNKKSFTSGETITFSMKVSDDSSVGNYVTNGVFGTYAKRTLRYNTSYFTIYKINNDRTLNPEPYGVYKLNTYKDDILSTSLLVSDNFTTGKYAVYDGIVVDSNGWMSLFGDGILSKYLWNYDGRPISEYDYIENSEGYFEVQNNEEQKIVKKFVTRLYEKVLNRTADSSGLNFHSTSLVNKAATGVDVAKGFIFSPEVTNKNLSNTEFIKMLYAALMDRTADASGLNYWNDLLANGLSREYVFRGFASSTEFSQICNSYGISKGEFVVTEPRDQNENLTKFVSRLYQKALERNAEVNGLNYYTQEILLKRVTPVQVSQNFIFSPEFKNKNLSNTDYIKVLYRTFMGREFDQSGLSYHLNRIKNGVNREEILLGFANSPEFKNIMNGFGL